MATFSVDLTALTVLSTDDNGETFDLNASGAQCATKAELAAFVRELCAQGMYDETTRDELLNEVEPNYQTVILLTTPDGWSRVVAFAKSEDSARRNLLVSSEGHQVGHVVAGSVKVGDALDNDDRRWRGW